MLAIILAVHGIAGQVRIKRRSVGARLRVNPPPPPLLSCRYLMTVRRLVEERRIGIRVNFNLNSTKKGKKTWKICSSMGKWVKRKAVVGKGSKSKLREGTTVLRVIYGTRSLQYIPYRYFVSTVPVPYWCYLYLARLASPQNRLFRANKRRKTIIRLIIILLEGSGIKLTLNGPYLLNS